jgi:hypothetical protein
MFKFLDPRYFTAAAFASSCADGRDATLSKPQDHRLNYGNGNAYSADERDFTFALMSYTFTTRMPTMRLRRQATSPATSAVDIFCFMVPQHTTRGFRCLERLWARLSGAQPYVRGPWEFAGRVQERHLHVG